MECRIPVSPVDEQVADWSAIKPDQRSEVMKITVETTAKSELARVWDAWNTPEDIQQWNAADESWHTTRSTVDLREGGRFMSRMEAKDGSAGFDFEGTYTRIVPQEIIEYRMADGREVDISFADGPDGVVVRVVFDAETENDPEYQRQGWQAIMDNFGRFVESKGG